MNKEQEEIEAKARIISLKVFNLELEKLYSWEFNSVYQIAIKERYDEVERLSKIQSNKSEEERDGL